MQLDPIKGKVLWQLAKKYDRFDHHIKALNFLVSKLDEVVKSGSPVNGFKHLLISFNNFLTNKILRTKILDGYQNVRKIKNNESDFSDILVLSEQKNLECLKMFLTFWYVIQVRTLLSCQYSAYIWCYGWIPRKSWHASERVSRW